MKLLESIIWYANRLRAMKPAEVSHRVGEKWRQSTEAGFLRSLESFDVGPCRPVPRLPEKEEAMAELRSQLVEDAEQLQKGLWQLFGWRTVEVGAPPCWHRDPVCGVVIDPEKPARQLNHRHLPDGADARTIWEINRWAEITRLGMHGWLNDDVSALRNAQLWLEDWCVRNPPGVGINWTSPLEVALRLINFAWFDALVSATGAVSGTRGSAVRSAQAILVQRIVPVHAGWIWRYRSAGSSANNHLLGELVALVVSVSRWPGLEKIACSASVAWDALEKEVLHQFAPDGGSKEQALHYHAFALELAMQAVRAVGCRAGKLHDRLNLAAGYLQALAHAGAPWDFGDSDDAQVVPLTLRRETGMAEWLHWLRGEEGALRFWLGACPWRSEPSSGSSWLVFLDSGMAVLRRSGWMVRLDASPLGFGSLAAHGHGDALHVSIWDGDEALIIDPGTGGYYGHKELRAELAAWRAHNGPQPIAGYRSPKRLGTFLWSQHHAKPSLQGEISLAHARFHHEGHDFRRTVEVIGETVQINDIEEQKRPFILRFCLAHGSMIQPAPATDVLNFRMTRGKRIWEFSFPLNTSVAFTEQRISAHYGSIETAPVLLVESFGGKADLMIRRCS